MNPAHEPEVEFFREEQRQQERALDDEQFEPVGSWSWLDDPDTADLPGDESD